MRSSRRIAYRVRSRRTLEAGTSLVEVTVVVALLAIMLPAFYGTLSFVQRQAKVTTDRFSATSNAQIVMDRLNRELRAAAAPTAASGLFVSATSLDVTFYASLGARSLVTPFATLGPTLIHVCAAAAGASTCPTSPTPCYSPASAGSAWPGCSLLEVVTKATGTLALPLYTGPSSTQVLATNVSSAGAIFAYYTVASITPITPAVLGTTVGRASIQEVWITIATQANRLSTPISMAMQVPLPNIDYGQSS